MDNRTTSPQGEETKPHVVAKIVARERLLDAAEDVIRRAVDAYDTGAAELFYRDVAADVLALSTPSSLPIAPDHVLVRIRDRLNQSISITAAADIKEMVDEYFALTASPQPPSPGQGDEWSFDDLAAEMADESLSDEAPGIPAGRADELILHARAYVRGEAWPPPSGEAEAPSSDRCPVCDGPTSFTTVATLKGSECGPQCFACARYPKANGGDHG